ncbi:Armadillo-type fold,Armadillo-like helical [Cinara cedri]|uniref:Armadillo-type fold,Armadillo-like helical n=1 Tax=Cinara cedri TaxID=506608 RepID=A0A5E4NKK2_9HEMI|nr:Armadillo-type fold,Armadillo-like helical [Cinara cedri]
MMGDNFNECDKYFKLLLSENRKVRKQNLDELMTIVSEKKFEESSEFVASVKTFVYPCLNDTSEACRESAIQLVRSLVCSGHVDDIVPIVFIIHKRMGNVTVTESSEEIKLLYVQLLRDIIKNTKQSILPCLDDLISILTKSILDPCPEVKKNSCLCAMELASTTKTHFHMVAESLVEPILKTSNYHQSTIRYTAIQSLNYVIMYSNGKQVVEVCDTLSERLFDQNVGVRLALYRVVANWMLNLHDRYSYFPKLVPLILTAQVDEHQPNREEAERLWDEIGSQYINENEVQLKEKLDFLPEYLDHYPPDVKRPNLGCRTLVTREVLKLLPVIIRELDDWAKDVSIKSGQLLCVVALNAENSIIQHLNQLLTAMTKCCYQPNHVASVHVRKAAEIMSYFISPDTYLKFLLPAMSDTEPHLGHMNVLSGLLKNVKPDELSTHVQSIITLFVKPEICEVYDPLFKKYLLQVIEYMLIACKLECQEFSYELFKIYITVKSTMLDQFEDNFIFKELINMCEPQTKEQLFKMNGEKLLNELNDSCDMWTVHSPGRKVLDKISRDAEYVILSCYEIYRQILVKTLQNFEKDPKFLMKMMININTCVDKNIFVDKQLWQILSGIIFPVQTWRPGKTAESLRAASCLCAQNIINKFTSFNDIILKQSIPIFLALADDNHSKTREYALDALNTLVYAAKKLDKIDADTINNITRVALARLNDNPGSTRFKAINLIKVTYTEPLPNDYMVHYEAHITQLYKTIVIFLDDEDLQKLVLDLLKELSWMKPEDLIKHINVNVFSHKHYAQNLMDYLSDKISQIALVSK